MENSWTHYKVDKIISTEILLSIPCNSEAWLGQSNHIFSRLQITSNFEDYGPVHAIQFKIIISNPTAHLPSGYLFLCPTAEFRTGPASFRWPDFPAHWSLDPSGVDRPSSEEATQLRFPSFQLATQVRGYSWDTSVYTGLRQFHQAKRFDPDSQDIARHLGQPLYRLCREVETQFAHMDELIEVDETGDDTDDERDDAQSSLHDQDELAEESDAKEDEDKIGICSEPQDVSLEQNVSKLHEPIERRRHSVDPGANPEPQIPNDHATGGGFIDHLIWGLRQGLTPQTDVSSSSSL
ncbi:hypothetical protein C8F04DRAFT_999485 [Mycena alexandri]|uniref:Uncharacterized protein n=1 Tax=Mycena alexandri TaxID=1745969 RepID=A0AAD6T031_9AGAR|nr:hypothetical protein C8F04DRAFT_999485 [Mycena alexandri]